jgi:cation diffusion facilitator family transporter
MPIRIQRYIALLSVLLFIGKMWAWYITHSVSIFTDAMESTVNVLAGFIGLYSVIQSSRPRDVNHPYGHGKIEFISTGIEGALIIISGFFIIYEAINQFIEPRPLHRIDVGVVVIAIAGAINYAAGLYAERTGKKQRSVTLQAAGKHLKSDAYSTIAIVLGLVLLLITKWQIIDGIVGMVFACVILFTGYKVIRKSLAGIMDEADQQMLNDVVVFLQENRRPQWIDLHNLRVIQYGEVLHIDTHMTLPWYENIATADKEIHALEDLIKTHFGNKVEFFIHVDGCMTYQCKLCAVQNCTERKETFQQQVAWNMENIWNNSKHGKVVN